MKVIAGLGNPGEKYANTPHSIGFEVVDAIASAIGASWEEKRAYKSMLARGSFAGFPVLLVKPQTYMNLSGDAVAPLVKYSNATAADLLVIHDDIDIALGRLRVRRGGSCGGHNGVRSIIERLGTQDFARLKLGVGRDGGSDDVIGHVLGKFSPEARKVADALVADAAKAAGDVLSLGVEKAMNQWNARK
ncbi:MAG: aminoacyl-tRNA hydrolase [Kiritimatiellae bacterium]|nr:aminoacyl-tRNA hydrolase [Kiritimatiellia bacterium]